VCFFFLSFIFLGGGGDGLGGSGGGGLGGSGGGGLGGGGGGDFLSFIKPERRCKR